MRSLQDVHLVYRPIDLDRYDEIRVAYWLQKKESDHGSERTAFYRTYELTLKELCTSVSSRSMTIHFLPASSGRISWSSGFAPPAKEEEVAPPADGETPPPPDLARATPPPARPAASAESPVDPPLPPPPPEPLLPLPDADAFKSLLFRRRDPRFPKQQMMEQRKLDLFFESKEERRNGCVKARANNGPQSLNTFLNGEHLRRGRAASTSARVLVARSGGCGGGRRCRVRIRVRVLILVQPGLHRRRRRAVLGNLGDDGRRVHLAADRG